MLTLLAEARRAVDEGESPLSLPVPPRFDRMIGVEIRPRVAGLARDALKADAEIVQTDARQMTFGHAKAVLLFDVLHLMSAAEQDAVLAAVANTLEENGVMLVREADSSAGLRFQVVRVGNRLKAMAVGAWGQQFYFRTRTEWLEVFARHGFDAEVRAMNEGTPFANLLFRLKVAKPSASGSTLRV